MAFDFEKIYAGITPVTIDGQHMIKIPRYYHRVFTATEGENEGKIIRQISDIPREGFHVHPAFVRNGRLMDCFYYGAYEASMEGFPNGNKWDSSGKQRVLTGYKACSLPNVHVWNYIFKEEAATACNARNVADTEDEEKTGWHLHNVYEVAAIAELMLIEYAATNFQELIGRGNVDQTWTTSGNTYGDDKTVLTGASDAVWRGIHELWGNVWEHYDGVYTDDSGVLYIFSNQMDGTYVNTGVGFPTADEILTSTTQGYTNRKYYRGWITELSTAKGEKFDLSDIFFPSVLKGKYDSANTGGTYHDFAWHLAKNYYGATANANYRPQTNGYCHGGFNCGSRVGPFIWHANCGCAYAHYGFRLARYGEYADAS